MLRTLLAVAVLFVAACNAAPAATVAPTAAPTVLPTPGPATVSLSSAGYFVGPDGMTLYTFDNDTLGHSVCEADCLENWPTLNVGSTPEITVGPGLDLAEFTAITRDDGGVQVTYKLIPLYYFAGDQATGDTKGDGVGGVWHLAMPGSTLPTPAPETPTPAPETPAAATPAVTPGTDCDPLYDYGCDPGGTTTPASAPAATPATTAAASPAASMAPLTVVLSEDGESLTDEAGMALYTFDNDEEELASTCEDTCAENWPPLLLPDGATIVPGEGVEGELVAFARADATMQVAYNGDPLYYFAGDLEAGDTNGDGINDVWHLAVPAPMVNPL
jgi:predicted lipoprotein with Yx(FWY)xxD motif